MTDPLNNRSPVSSPVSLPSTYSPSTLIVFAHPNRQHSRANRHLLQAVADRPNTQVRDLYDLYPHGFINIKAEQAALSSADHIVLQHPLYWYSVPSLLKEWIDATLVEGWAFGRDGNALKGKKWAHALTAGGSHQTYQSQTNMEINALLLPLEKTALLCKTNWQAPFVVLGAGDQTDDELNGHARRYGQWLDQFSQS